jgi:two-component sensor histidine kinase/CHASE1-domain containing sensor protein
MRNGSAASLFEEPDIGFVRYPTITGGYIVSPMLRMSKLMQWKPHQVTLIVGLVLTLLLMAWSSNEIEQRARLRLERALAEADFAVRGRLETYVALLRSFDGLIHMRGIPRPGEFAEFHEQLDVQNSYPGLRGIGFAMDLGGASHARAMRTLRARGYRVKLWPEGNRERYTAIVLLQPLDAINAPVLGYDMFSEARRRNAMNAAIESGSPALTVPIQLVQDAASPGVQAGFLMYTATHARSGAFLGWTYAAFRAQEFFGSAIGPALGAAVEVRDAQTGELLYRDNAWQDNARPTLAGRVASHGANWTVSVSDASGGGVRSPAVWLIGVVGVALSLSLCSFLWWRDQIADRLRGALANEERARRASDILRQEVNHRVGNSLALVSSLLSLQLRRTPAGEARDAIQEALARISAVAQVHKRLNYSETTSSVNMSEFLTNLVEDLQTQMVADPEMIDVKMRLEPLEMTTAQALPMGVIIAELVTNSIKYAFPEGRGVIEVALWRDGSGTCFAVRDNGIGFGAHAPAGSGLGGRIIEAMAAQLGAQVQRQSDARGASISCCIPDREARAA